MPFGRERVETLRPIDFPVVIGRPNGALLDIYILLSKEWCIIELFRPMSVTKSRVDFFSSR